MGYSLLIAALAFLAGLLPAWFYGATCHDFDDYHRPWTFYARAIASLFDGWHWQRLAFRRLGFKRRRPQ